MALSKEQVIEQTRLMLDWRRQDAYRLDLLYRYYHGTQQFVWLSTDVPTEVQKIAEMSRVNVLGLAVDSVAQTLYVDGYRSPSEEGEAPAWDIWQKNKLDARQIGVHRSALNYGVSYVTVIPGKPVPVIRGISPRNLTVVYGEDDDWPMWALEKRRSAETNKTLYRLFDDEMTYWVSVANTVARNPAAVYPAANSVIEQPIGIEYISAEEHGCGVVPVVRFLSKSDLDDEVASEFDNLKHLQDQIDLTTFGLLVVQHYGAFPQKWIAGWLAETEEDQVKVGAHKVLTFEDPDTKLGQFEAADLGGYIASRRDTLKNLAAIAQMSENALRGELVNLSAEALEAAKDQERRKLFEKETMFGESWEQTLELAGQEAGVEMASDAEVRWKDMEMRTFAATVDGLGKMAQMLGIPVEEIWERVPGATQQEIARWKTAAQLNGDVFAQMTRQLERQATANAEF